MNGLAGYERAHRKGKLDDSFRLLQQRTRNSVAEAVTFIELLYLRGDSDRARNEAEAYFATQDLEPSCKSRLLSVLAAIHADRGDIEAAVNFGQQALRHADEANDSSLSATTSALLLERTCDRVGFDVSLPLAAQVRRRAIRCTDVQTRAVVHLTFGRLEGRVGHLRTALRHFAVGRHLIAMDPNEMIQAAIDLDESSVLFLLGDVPGALEMARRAAWSAQQSGWAKGKTVALLNVAQYFVSLGRIADADSQIGNAQHLSFWNVTHEVGLADTRAQIAFCRGLHDVAHETLLAADNLSDGVSQWHRLTNQVTRNRLLIRQGRWHEAVSATSTSLRSALELGAEQLAAVFRYLYGEALVGSGQLQKAVEAVGWANESEGVPLALIGHSQLITAKMLLAAGSSDRGRRRLGAARRILNSAGDKLTETEALNISEVDESSGSEMSSSGLDAAVSLLDLAGHPQVLGREAFAILRNCGGVQGIALGARSSRGLRIVETHKWTESEATKRFSAAAPKDVMCLGEHLDEAWELLAEPGASLDHQCTWGAIRRLVSAASALDQYRRDEKQRAALWPAEALDGDPESLWVSEQSLELVTLARRLASSHLPILITGETGTGKEMLARLIHRASNRAERPLVPVNCTAVPRELLESQLFGYRRGAFTGAETSFNGVIRSATGGTLFLDEIGDLHIDLQPKLLRFIELGEVQPLGEAQAVKVDVRIIAATNANLESLAAQGRFREDLLYRLKILTLALPPLRERREEIPALLQYYLQKCGDEQRKGRLTLSDETLEYLLLYSWPGNIRQLANEVRRMTALAEPDSTLTPSLLSPEIQATRRTVASSASADPEVRVRLDQPLPAAVDALEQSLVRHALQRSHGKVEEAARMLGISRKGLFLKRRRWGLQQAS